MASVILKKKRVSKRNKKSWRKHTDIRDVDIFLDEQRLEERLGLKLHDRKDNDLFKIDKIAEDHQPKIRLLSEKKRRALEPPRCFKALEPTTSVPDPITKRNRVKSEEERKCDIHKLIEARNKKNGILKKKEREAIQNRILTRKLKKNILKHDEIIKHDLWADDKETYLGDAVKWLTDDHVRHVLTNVGKFKVRHPRTFMRDAKKYHSALTITESPHPGMSYNPTFVDHQELLKEVADKENKRLKEEEHLKRTTTDMFVKVTVDERAASWLTEMSQGLEGQNDDEENGGEYKAINPPTSFTKKKTLKKRRKQKEARMEELKKKKTIIEKKKIADIYKLKFLSKDLDEKDKKSARLQENRAKRKENLGFRTKRLNNNKYEEPDLVFKRAHELTGNLRSLEPEGSILADRFYSMQKRNILPPSVKQNKTKRAKVKRYIKPGFRMETKTT